jgi:hypothetical protein
MGFALFSPMRLKRIFSFFWLILGLLQVFSPNAGANALLSTDPEEPSPSLRVSRDFFRRDLKADVRVAGGRGGEKSSSPVVWRESEPAEVRPDPASGPVLASFPDSRGCAEFSAGRICFTMMGDVSNLGLNDREMRFQPESLAESPAGDRAAGYHVTQVKKSEDQVEVRFVRGSSTVDVILTARD